MACQCFPHGMCPRHRLFSGKKHASELVAPPLHAQRICGGVAQAGRRSCLRSYCYAVLSLEVQPVGTCPSEVSHTRVPHAVCFCCAVLCDRSLFQPWLLHVWAIVHERVSTLVAHAVLAFDVQPQGMFGVAIPVVPVLERATAKFRSRSRL